MNPGKAIEIMKMKGRLCSLLCLFAAAGAMAQLNVFPNPVKDGFYVSIPLANPGNKMVQLKLFTASGHLINAKEITAQQAVNYYFDMNAKFLPGGNYNLQIVFDNTVITTKKLLIIR